MGETVWRQHLIFDAIRSSNNPDYYISVFRNLFNLFVDASPWIAYQSGQLNLTKP
jgi:hypothetical protein